MSEHTQTGNGTETQANAPTPRKRRTGSRSPNAARPAFVILQVLDESGNATAFDKRRLRIVATERSAEKVMEAMESGEHPNAFYLRVLLPPGTRAGSPNRPKAD